MGWSWLSYSRKSTLRVYPLPSCTSSLGQSSRFSAGIPLVVCPRFEPAHFCSAIQTFKVSVRNSPVTLTTDILLAVVMYYCYLFAQIVLIVPPIILFLANSPIVTQYDLSTVRLIMSGAAPLAPDLTKKLSERLTAMGAKVFIVQGYGLTETRCVLSFSSNNGESTPDRRPHSILELNAFLLLHSCFYSFAGVASPGVLLLTPELSVKKVGSVGELLPNVEARLVDDDEKDVRPGEPGELWARGPNVMK